MRIHAGARGITKLLVAVADVDATVAER